MPTIRVMRFSGSVFDVTVAESEITQFLSIQDLKFYLASADESKPPVSLVQLIDPKNNNPMPPEAKIPLSSVIDPEPSAPLLRYVITDDVMWILRHNNRHFIPPQFDGDWPETDGGREQPWKMFESRVAEASWRSAYDVYCGYDGCKEFMDALKWLALGLKEDRINEVYQDGTNLLFRICRCTLQWGKYLQAFEFDTLLLEFVQLPHLRSETISKSFSLLGKALGRLWDLPYGAEIALALLKQDAGREFWAGRWWEHGDNLLQFILDPMECWKRRTNINAEVCIALAEKFSLREFCHLSETGFYALNYTECLVEQAARMGEEELWLKVREAIKSNMIKRFKEHAGPVKDLAEITDKLWLKSNGLPQAEEVLKEFEDNLVKRVRKHLVDKKGLNNGFEDDNEDLAEKTDRLLSEVCQMHRCKIIERRKREPPSSPSPSEESQSS